MRVMHVCLAAFYIDGFGYQENILPKLHKEMGNEVEIVASTQTYLDNVKLGFVAASSYTNEYGIRVHRLPYVPLFPLFLAKRIRAYLGLRERLTLFRPDLIFVHDVQFWDLLTISAYKKETGATVVADCHADLGNSARGFFARWFLHGIFYKAILQVAKRSIDMLYPTLPIRAEFLRDVYGLRDRPMRLLPFGADDTQDPGVNRAVVRRRERERLGIAEDDIVLVSGGKLDGRKNIHLLIERFSDLYKAGRLRNFHLVVFGQPDAYVEGKLASIERCANVHLIGWLPADETYRAFWASDLAIFPGTHSVLWEEALGHGLGLVVLRWPGIDHLDLGGNIRYLDEASSVALDELFASLEADGGQEVLDLTAAAALLGPSQFSYRAIARKALDVTFAE